MTLQNRYDFVYLFDVKDGNPNGDPDAGNQPRMDPETGMGLITDVCLKRKVRNYVQLSSPENDIFIREKAILNNLIAEAREQPEVKEKKTAGEKTEAARQYMCKRFYDVRTFGAVMSTGENAGQVRGPVQFCFSRSIDPIFTHEHSITRMAVATEEEAKKQKGGNRTMGRKHTVPYGLYRCHGFISSGLAGNTGFSEEDLDLFWDALKNMFDHDRSAARGEMTARRLIIFKHESSLGNAAAHTLFERVQVRRLDGSKPPREFSDYEITADDADLPSGITFMNLI